MTRKLRSEPDIISDLKILFPTSSRVREGIGDDAAIIEGQQIVSTDAIVEGVHFLREKASWDEVAYKLFASNASDMAAMGGKPYVYNLALSLPEYWENEDLRLFLLGVRQFLEEFPADLIGGDLVRSKEFFASVTVIGKPVSIPWRRSGAQVGDFIYVTGTLGDSKLWLDKELGKRGLPLKDLDYFRSRHYKPTPRINWVDELVKYNVTSAIDISDGLVEDLKKLTQASGCSFMLDADHIPMSYEQIGRNNFQEHKDFYIREALVGGEDYEVLFTSPQSIDEDLLAMSGICVSNIGRILTSETQSFVSLNKQRFAVEEFQGFRH